MKLNTSVKQDQIYTAEGAVAKKINPKLQLERLVMSCMLWEDNFYVDGYTVANWISELIDKVSPTELFEIVMKARNDMKLRHVPLLIAREMARSSKHKHYVKYVLEHIIQRPDELTEYLSIYWKDGRQSISAQSKKGLAAAFKKFDEYQLAKYNRDTTIKLKDVLFMCHAKPKDKEQEDLWKRLIDDELQVPDTWEVELSKQDGLSKKDKWIRLLTENKLGGLALIRNLRNMIDAKVNDSLIIDALDRMKVDKILPFRFIAAARYAPRLEPQLESAMFKCLEGHEKLEGKTALLVDVSGSMDVGISQKSDMLRLDAACALSMLVREICDNVMIYTFSSKTVLVPPRRGFALRDAIVKSQDHGWTNLGDAVDHINKMTDVDRLIVFTDEQSHNKVPDPKCEKAYMINVATNKNGVGYGKWNHIDGFSEKIVDFIQLLEKL